MCLFKTGYLDAKKNSHIHKNANNWRILLGNILESTLESLSCYMYKQDKCKWVSSIYIVSCVSFSFYIRSNFCKTVNPKFFKLWIHTTYIWSMKIEYWFCLTQHVIVHSKHMLNISFIHEHVLYTFTCTYFSRQHFLYLLSWKRCMIDPRYIIYMLREVHYFERWRISDL